MTRSLLRLVAEHSSRVQLVRALDRLPADRRAVFRFIAVDGLSYTEAATALGITIAQVETRLAEALIDIQDQFDGRHASGGWHSPTPTVRRDGDAR